MGRIGTWVLNAFTVLSLVLCILAIYEALPHEQDDRIGSA